MSSLQRRTTTLQRSLDGRWAGLEHCCHLLDTEAQDVAVAGLQRIPPRQAATVVCAAYREFMGPFVQMLTGSKPHALARPARIVTRFCA